MNNGKDTPTKREEEHSRNAEERHVDREERGEREKQRERHGQSVVEAKRERKTR